MEPEPLLRRPSGAARGASARSTLDSYLPLAWTNFARCAPIESLLAPSEAMSPIAMGPESARPLMPFFSPTTCGRACFTFPNITRREIDRRKEQLHGGKMSGADQCTSIRLLQLVVVSIVILSVCTDVAGFLRFAPSLGLPTWAAVLCVIPTKLVESSFLMFGARLWRQGWLGKLQSPVYVAIWAIAVGLSALAAYGTVFNALAAADNGAATRAETRVILVAALARTNAQLDSFSKPLPRPVRTVEQDLSWAVSVAAVTRHCLRRPALAARDEDCKKVINLRKELAAAKDYEHLVHETARLRDQLAGISISVAHDPMPRAFEVTLGRVLPMDGKAGIALMGTLMLCLVSAFGPFGLDTLRAGFVKQAPAQRADGADASIGTAQRQRPLGAQVIQFRSGNRPPSPGSRQIRSAQPLSGQTRRPALGKVDHEAAGAAIRAFVGKLELGEQARATGSQLANAYAAQRWRFGWPALPANVIGMHLKAAVEELGGRKLKSGGQVYEGVCLPAAWREPQAQSA